MQIDGFRPTPSMYWEPVPVPHAGPGSTPGSSITLSCEWWGYIAGCVGHMREQGAWNTSDQAVMQNAIANVDDLLDMIAAAAAAGDCATVALDCSYDFALSQASPWQSSPTLTVSPTEWSLIIGWLGGYNTFILADYGEVAIQGDFLPFTVTGFTVAYALASSGNVGDAWSARFFDHDLNLLYEMPDDLGNPVVYSGPPIPNVSRIIVHRRQDASFMTTLPQIEQVYIQGTGAPGNCNPLVPLAIPPEGCSQFDFTLNDGGWFAYSNLGCTYANYSAGAWRHGTHGAPPCDNAETYTTIRKSFPQTKVLSVDVYIEQVPQPGRNTVLANDTTDIVWSVLTNAYSLVGGLYKMTFTPSSPPTCHGLLISTDNGSDAGNTIKKVVVHVGDTWGFGPSDCT